MRRAFLLLSLGLLAGSALYLLAQAASVTEDFQADALGSTPAGWFDDLVGSLTSRQHGFFQIAADPEDSSNRILALAGDAGMESGSAIPRTGLVAHRLSPVFDLAGGTFSFTGRLYRGSADGAAGAVFLSAYPARDAYYLLGCWASGSDGAHFWLAGNGALPAGPIDLGVAAEASTWYRFRVQADASIGGTRIRARIWPDGQSEPAAYNIDIVDSSVGRLSAGRIGFWASRKGFKAIDDLSVSGGAAAPSPTPTPTAAGPDATATPTPTPTPTGGAAGPTPTPTGGVPGTTPTPTPTGGTPGSTPTWTPTASGAVIVHLTDSGKPLRDGSYFNRDVHPAWTIEGGTPPYTTLATLAGHSVQPGTTVSAEGSYRLAVSATDATGSKGAAAASFTIDKTPPAFSNLRPDSNAILPSRVVAFSGNVSPDAVSVSVAGRTAAFAGGFFSLPDLSLSEGKNTVALSATDRAGNIGTLAYPLTVDTTPPLVAITSPADHSVTKNGTVTVSGTVADASAVTVSVNGIAAVVSAGTFSASGVPLSEGPNPIQAAARDAAGNASQAAITVDRDTMPPTISILDGSREIVDGDLLNHRPAPVIAVSDAHLTSSSALLNGSPFVSGTPIASDGAFQIDVDASDAAGNTAHKTVHFTVDTQPPRITIISPADGAVLTSSPQPVTGDCDDAVTVTVNGTPATVSGGHFRIDAFSFAEGQVTLSIIGRDRAGNAGTASVTVLVDTLAPVVSITSPASGAFLKTATATVTGTASDANLVSVSVNGIVGMLGAGGSFTATGVPLPEGPVTLTATATDRGGHTGTASVAVVADRTPPQITVTESGTPLSPNTIFRRHPRIVFAATDANAVTVQATLNGAAFASGTEIDNDGSYTLEVDAADAAGNTAVASIPFSVDTTPPRITNLQPGNGTLTRQTSVAVSGDCDDAVTVTVNRIAAVVSGGHFVASSVALSEGSNTLPISAHDAAGNEGTASLVLVRDTTPPQITISSPAPNFLTSASSVTVAGTATDDHLSGVDVNGGAATLNGSNFQRDVSLTEGANTLVATARDSAGNSASANVSVTRDSTPPAIAITSPADGAIIGLSSTQVTGDVSDAHLDKVSVNGVAAAVSAGHFTVSSVSLTTGSNTLTALATDLAGNSSTSTVHVTRDDGALSVSIDTPAAGARLRAQPIAVSGPVSAAAVGVTVNGVAATLAAGRFSASGVPLNEGSNTLTARATDGGGGTGVATETVFLDTTAPTVVSVTPASDAVNVPTGAVVRVVFSEAIDPTTVTAVSLTLTPDTGGAPVSAILSVSGSEADLVPTAALSALVLYRVDATTAITDLAGNPLASAFSSRFTTGSSGGGPTTPILDPVTPALCASSITVTGSADSGDQVRCTGGATVATSVAGPDGRFSIIVALNPDQVNALSFIAIDAQNHESSPATATVRADCTPPRVESAALSGDDLVITFSEAMDPATVTLGSSGSLSLAGTGGELGSTLSLSGDGITAHVTGIRPLSGETFTLTVNRNAKDLVGNPLLAPFIQTFTPELNIGLLGQVLDDAIGRPLPGAVVTVLAIDGSSPGAPAPTTTTDGEGRFSLVVPGGEIALQATRDGYAPVTRIEVASPGQAETVFDLRLTPQVQTQAAADGSVTITDGGLVVFLPAGSLPASAPVVGGQLSPQGLPALPPLGWTCAAAAVLDLSGGAQAARPAAARPAGKLAVTISASWQNSLGIASDAALLLARWDQPSRRYLAAGQASVTADGSHIEATLPSDGSYAVLAADSDPFAPPIPEPDQPVGGVAPPDTSPITSASVSTDPTAVLPTQTAEVTAQLSLSGPIPSGYPVQALISETLTLLDGSTVQVPSFLADLIVVRDGAGDALVPFRVRPSDTAAAVALSVGYENLQIKQYPFEVRRGDLLSPAGGVVGGEGGFSLAVPAGALSQTIPVNISPITDPKDLPIPIPQGFQFLAAVNLNLGDQTLALPAALRWASASDPTGGGLVWIMIATIGGVARPLFVAPGRYDSADSWVETVPADVHQLPLPGVVSGGLYVLLAAQNPPAVAFVKGHVLDVGGQPLPGALVTQDANSIVSLCDGSGSYGLALPASGTTVRSSRLDTGNQGSAAVASQPSGATALVDIQIVVTAPYVSSVAPDTSTLLPLDLPVVLNISEPLDSSTVNTSSVSAQGPAGALGGTVALSSSGTQVTFTPSLPWPGNAWVSVTLSSAVTDRTGYRLVDKTTKAISDFTASYTTVDPTPPGDVNPLLIAMGLPQGTPPSVSIVGGAGAACGGCTVTAVDETTAATSSTTAGGDGSFSLTLQASLSDVVSILIQRPSGGGQIKVSAGPFRSDGGRTAIVGTRAADYVTADRIRVTLPDGTFSAPTTLRVTPIAETDLALPVPSLAKYAGGVSFDPGSTAAANPIDIGVAAPSGVTSGTFLVAREVEVLGQPRWMVVDTARYDNGEITTRPISGSQSAFKKSVQGMLLAPAGAKSVLDVSDSAKNLLDRITRTSNLVFLQLTSEFAFLQGSIESPNATVTFTFGAQYDYLSNFIPFVWVAREAKQQSYFLVPIPSNADYTLNVLDSTTGFTIFQGNFSGLSDPSNITQLPPGATPADLPAPRLESASPFTALTFVPVPGAAGQRRLLLPGIEYEYSPDDSGQGTVSLYGSAGSLPANVKATIQDNLGSASASASVTTGADGSFGPLSIAASLADDLTFTAGTRSLSLTSGLRLSFTEPFIKDALQGQILVTDADASPSPATLTYDLVPDTAGTDGSRSFTLLPAVQFMRGHRITLHLPGGDGAPQATTSKPLPASIDVEMFTPKDDLIGGRPVNDVNALALTGGLLLEATADQLLNLYDASDPGNVRPCDSKTLYAPARGILLDDHDRILVSMGGGGAEGRLQVFLLGPVSPSGGDCGGRKLIDQEKLELSYTQLTVRTGTENPPLPEGFPRTIRLFSNDSSEEVVLDRDTPALVHFDETDASPADGKQDVDSLLRVSGTIPSSGAPSPLNQPATVFNETTGRSWTAYADASGAFSIDARASSGDRLKIVLNNAEVALVATLSFGIQGVEVNRTMHEIGQSCDSDSGGGDSICPEKTRLLFSFGGAPDSFGAPPTVQLCREYDLSNNCADLVTDLERLNDIDLLPGVVGPGPVQPSGQPLITAAVSRFGLGLFTIASGSSGYQIQQVGNGVRLQTPGIPPTFPELFAVAATRDFPVKPPAERTSCLAAKWPDYKPSLAFVAAGTTGVFVVDVTDANNPEQVGLFKVSDSDAGANTLALDAKRGLLYVGMGGEGIVVYDMTDPCTTALPSGMAGPSDSRVISRIPVVNENVNVPFAFDPDTGVIFGAGDAGDNEPPDSGQAFALSPLDPPLSWIADTDHDGQWEQVATAIPLGVTNPNSQTPPLPAVVHLLAEIYGGAGPEIVVPVASTSDSGVALPPAWSGMARTKTYVGLKRQSDDPADPGYNRYLSPPIVLIADARARAGYHLIPAEDDGQPEGAANANACRNCSAGPGYNLQLVSLQTPPPPDNDGRDKDHPIEQAFEQFTGRKLVARLAEDQTAAAALRNQVTYLNGSDLLRVEADLATAPGDLSPDVAQVPRVNASTVADEAGSQVMLSSGELIDQAADLFIAGREGNDFSLQRFYSSGAIHFGPFGQNWDSPLFARLRDLPNGDVEYYDGTMRRETFQYMAATDSTPASFKPPPGRFAELYRLPDRTFFLLERDKTTLRFDESGRLLSISDRVRTSESEVVGDGNRIRFFYDGAGRLSVITDSLGHTITLNYYAQDAAPGNNGAYPDLISSVVDHTGREVLYNYDVKGRLIEVALPEITSNGGGQTFAGAARRKVDYAYGDSSNPSDVKTNLHETNNLIQVKNARGQEVLAIDYADSFGFGAKEAVVGRTIAGIPERFSYDAPSLTATFTDRRGHDRTVVHDSNGHPVSDTLAINDTSDAGADAGVPQVSLPGGTVPAGPFTTTTSYGDDGLTKTVLLPSGRNVSYGYQPVPSDATDRRSRANVIAETANGPGAPSPQTDQYAYEPLLNAVTSHTDPTGATTTFTRDPSKGFLIKVTEPATVGLSGAAPIPGTNISRDPDTGQALSTADFGGVGRVMTYFDRSDPAFGYLQSVTEQADSTGSIYASAPPSATTYTRDARGNVLSVTDPRGVTTTYEVNEADQVVKATLASSSSNPDTPALSIVKTFEYDADGNLVRESWPQAGVGTATRTHEYDALNRLTQTTEGGVLAAAATTRYQYDSSGNVVVVTQPEGEKDVSAYDGRNQLVGQVRLDSTESVSSSVRSLTRDEDGRVVEDFDGVNTSTTVHYDGLGRADQITTPRGAQIAVVYDDADRPIHVTVTDPGGQILKERQTNYASNGQVAQQIDLLRKTPADIPAQVATSFFYDIGARLIETTDPLSRVTLRGYDDHGRVIRLEDPAHNVSAVGYDLAGNPIQRTDSDVLPGGGYEADRIEQSKYDALSRVTQSIDPLSHATSFAYDEPGNLLSVVDALTHKTSYSYDELGRRLTMVDGVGNAGTASQHQTQWSWDGDSRLKAMTDAEGKTTGYVYDPIGRLSEIDYPDTQKETRIYNGDGTIALATDQNGSQAAFTYGPDDQPEQILYQRGTSVVGMRQETYGYDVLGRLTSASTDAGIGGSSHVTARTYDSLDRILTETEDGQAITRSFDLVGNPTQTTLPGSGRSFARSFDELNRLGQLDELLSPDGTSRRTVRAYDYVGPNRIAADRAFGNLSSAYEYDTARRLTKLTSTNNGTTTDFLKYVYGWNDDDVPKFEQRNHEAGRGDAYQQDEDHRLTMAGLSQSDPTAAPDAAGPNREALTLGAVHERTAEALTLSGATSNNTVSSNPRYGYMSYGPDTNRTYDKAGSMTSNIRGTYQWDARHRLVEADLADGSKLFYGYDALGRRVEKKKMLDSNSTSTTFLFDGWNAVQEIHDGSLYREAVFGEGLDDSLEYRIFGSSTNRDYEVFRDRSGSTGAVVDDDGTTHLFKYVTFGKASQLDSAGSGDYNFDLSAETTTSLWQGLELDPDLGWYYARNRWYDPDTGSFTATDPLGYPDSANPYVWGVSEPWANDPMGLAMPASMAQFYDASEQGKLAKDDLRYLKWLAGDPGRLVTNSSYRRDFLTTAGGAVQHGLGWVFNRPEWDLVGLAGVVKIPTTAARVPKMIQGAERLMKTVEEAAQLAQKGETAAARTGRAVHEALAEERRAGEFWDVVNQTMTGHEGDPIRVPRRVDLQTGAPITEKGTQLARPDAVSYRLEIVLDDKTATRSVTKDRQQIIRYIKAYEQREGKLPKTIAIQRYDPVTGQPIRTDLFKPEDFLPKAGQ